MDSTPNQRDRIILAAQVDEHFEAFEIEMTPAEARSFGEIAPFAGVSKQTSLFTVVDRVNALIPPIDFGSEHPKTGKPHHTFRIGRRSGFRYVAIEIFKGFFQAGFDFMAMIEELHTVGTNAGAEVVIATDHNSYSIRMQWRRP